MKNNVSYYFLLVFLIVNFLYFIIGFIYQHDFSNGGKIDFEHIFNNFILFKNNSLLDIDWSRYESTSLPLHYLITKIIIPKDNIFLFKFYTFCLSLICIPLFYKVLSLRVNQKKFSLRLFSLSSVILLSSSFRTDGFFGLEENIGFFTLFLSFIFFYSYQIKNNYFLKIFTIIFSCIIFYSRQTYAFIPIITYFYFLDKKNLFGKNNFYLSLLYFIILAPSLYFFISWGSPVPTAAAFRLVSFQVYSLPIIFGMFVIFTLPFYLLSVKKILKRLNFKSLLLLIFGLFIYCYFFWKIPVLNFGGGPLSKLFLFNQNLKIVYLFFSYLGFITVIDLMKNNLNLSIFFLFFIFIYFFTDKAFFSYLDPLCLIIILVFVKNYIIEISNNIYKLTFFIFYFLILHLSWASYFGIYLRGIIR